VAVQLRRKEEDRLGKVQLTRKALHVRNAECLPLDEDTELVPLEWRRRENVDDAVGVKLV